MTRVVADTNVILRFLTQQPADHGRRAEALFKSAESGAVDVFVTVVVVAEVWAVLVHSMDKTAAEASEALSMVLRLRGVDAEDRDNVLAALQTTSSRVDFVDAYVARRAGEMDVAVASFDRDLSKRLGARVHPL